MPFLLLSKKRYVGMLYEKNPNKCKEKSMGIVLKRRDNANIVKDCYGGIIKIMMESQDIAKAVKFTKTFLQNMVDEKFPLEKLIISKSLRGFYKNPDSIAHRVLADRMGQRDPGNKPAVGSRIPYVYIQTKKKVKLQGDKIENPDYVIKEKLKPDYGFYITNQIQKPVTQVFALLLEQMPEFKTKIQSFNMKLRSLKKKHSADEKKYDTEETKLRNKHVKRIIFDSSIRQANNIKNGQKTIHQFF
jgi:DNA polymerase elongation subunit (family B)